MLVDSDVLIWYLRGNENAAEFLNGLATLDVSAVSYMELVQGCRNKQELERLKRDFAARQARVAAITEPICMRAMTLLEAHFLDDGLQMADALIAATALELRTAVVTANVKHFQVIDQLAVQPFTP
jgi:hypothetical protein